MLISAKSYATESVSLVAIGYDVGSIDPGMYKLSSQRRVGGKKTMRTSARLFA